MLKDIFRMIKTPDATLVTKPDANIVATKPRFNEWNNAMVQIWGWERVTANTNRGFYLLYEGGVLCFSMAGYQLILYCIYMFQLILHELWKTPSIEVIGVWLQAWEYIIMSYAIPKHSHKYSNTIGNQMTTERGENRKAHLQHTDGLSECHTFLGQQLHIYFIGKHSSMKA